MDRLRKFYRSGTWQKFRDIVLLERSQKSGFLRCEDCNGPILKKYDAICHHIIELTEKNIDDPNVSLNPANIKVLHHVCHNKAHNRFGFGDRRVYIVWGSPQSGKNTWVSAVADASDLIIDMDAIWECICISDRHNKPEALKANAFQVRDTLIQQVKMRVGSWNAAYVIGGYPLSGERERLADMLGAELVHIDTDEAECLSRCETDAWRGYVRDWWRLYQP